MVQSESVICRFIHSIFSFGKRVFIGVEEYDDWVVDPKIPIYLVLMKGCNTLFWVPMIGLNIE